MKKICFVAVLVLIFLISCAPIAEPPVGGDPLSSDEMPQQEMPAEAENFIVRTDVTIENLR